MHVTETMKRKRVKRRELLQHSRILLKARSHGFLEVIFLVKSRIIFTLNETKNNILKKKKTQKSNKRLRMSKEGEG